MLAEYHFKIEHVSRIDNTKANIFSRKAELQRREKPLGIILRLNKDRRVRYNYPQLAGTYKVLISL